MSPRRVAIVGSGMIGAALAWTLARRGFDVTIFEKGPDYPYPHREPFLDSYYGEGSNPAYDPAPAMTRTTASGSYLLYPGVDGVMRAGGNGTVWTALAMRTTPADFRTRTLYRFGDDWPIGYDELEPYLGRAEAMLGVSGTDEDNPWAPPRSTPYPLPPFELTADDVVLAGRLRDHGIHLHTTPQARTSQDYDGRPMCMNVAACRLCPTGSRYSPNHHLREATATGRCRVVTGTAVRRVLTDGRGRATGLLVRPVNGGRDQEHGADRVIVAGGAIETARLLLLSRDARHPDGLGNTGGHVGRHLVFHHIWNGHLDYREKRFAGKVGYWTGQSSQFCDPPSRGVHGGIKIEMPAIPWPGHAREAGGADSLDEAMARFEPTRRCRQLGMHAESVPGDGKYVTLSSTRDALGDPVSHVHYDSDDFDRRTHAFGRRLFERISEATGADEWHYPGLDGFGVYAHYMGTCRMGLDAAAGVTDPFGAVHDTPGLWAVGLANFVGSGGASNPTLTGVALALRAADRLAEEAG